MQPTKLYESLFLFHKFHIALQEQKTQLQLVVESKNKFARNHILMTNYIVMESVSFLDEFDQNFYHRCEEEYKSKVLLIRKTTAPIFKRIKQWKDLKDFRNNIIAHPWRDKNKRFVVPDINKYKVPRNWFQHIVLVNLIGYIYNIIREVFKKEFPLMFKYMESLVPKEKEKTNYKMLTEDHVAMALEVDAIAEKEGFKYDMKVLAYTFD